MGIADFFRPKHRHSDTRVRAEAVRALTADDAAILVQIAKTDQDVSVRRIAIEKIDTPDLLAEIAKAERERTLRDLAGERAAELWVSKACAADDDDVAADNSPANAAFAGLLRLGDQRAVAEIAARASSPILRKRALAELHDAKALAELAKTANAPEIRLEAVSRIDDPDVLRALATDTTLKEVGLAAVEQLDDPARLEIIAQKAKNKAVRQRARKIVGEMEAAERSQHQTGGAAPKVSDEAKRRRAEKAQLMRDVENVVESFDFAKTEIIVRNAPAAVSRTTLQLIAR